MINLRLKIEYIVGMLMVIFYYLNLCIIEKVLMKIYIRNEYYVKKKIISLNIL